MPLRGQAPVRRAAGEREVQRKWLGVVLLALVGAGLMAGCLNVLFLLGVSAAPATEPSVLTTR